MGEQFEKENLLRWDSLGEFLALAESLEMLGGKGSKNASLLAKGLHAANADFLIKKECQVSRKAMELDNRGSHFYLALYWARAMGKQEEDLSLKKIFSEMAGEMEEKETEIVKELNAVQGVKIDMGGYYKVDEEKTETSMRPCKIWNDILSKYGKMAEEAAGAAPAAPAAAPAAPAEAPTAPLAPEDIKIESSGKEKTSSLCGCLGKKSAL